MQWWNNEVKRNYFFTMLRVLIKVQSKITMQSTKGSTWRKWNVSLVTKFHLMLILFHRIWCTKMKSRMMLPLDWRQGLHHMGTQFILISRTFILTAVCARQKVSDSCIPSQHCVGGILWRSILIWNFINPVQLMEKLTCGHLMNQNIVKHLT